MICSMLAEAVFKAPVPGQQCHWPCRWLGPVRSAAGTAASPRRCAALTAAYEPAWPSAGAAVRQWAKHKQWCTNKQHALHQVLHSTAIPWAAVKRQGRRDGSQAAEQIYATTGNCSASASPPAPGHAHAVGCSEASHAPGPPAAPARMSLSGTRKSSPATLLRCSYQVPVRCRM